MWTERSVGLLTASRADEGLGQLGHDATDDMSTTGVVGGGTMGLGIAQVLAVAGCLVKVVEATEELAGGTRARLESLVRSAAERGRLADPRSVLDRVQVTSSIDTLAGAQLVVEAVPEVLELKLDVLARAERVLEPAGGAILATNTSSLSIDRLASGLRQPTRFCGMHFFNPVPASELVEIVGGAATSDQTVESARNWVQRLGKQSIVVRDSPGFASSRLGLLLGLEAIRMLEADVASAEDIDRAMVLGYKHPMGPLRLTDLVGLDVRLHIAEYLAQTLGARFDPPQLLRDKVAAGELGKKSGKGFFEW